MISDVGSIPILVTNAKESAKWYHEKLGFEIVSNEGHWVAVKPEESSVLIHLCGKCDSWGGDKPGGDTGIWLRSGEMEGFLDEKSGSNIPRSEGDKVDATYADLKNKGVEFDTELSQSPWGKYAKLKDPDGNIFWIW
jgi:catechol 2,3-dioxygenase-like lactoylglutathione lyase family enzyme